MRTVRTLGVLGGLERVVRSGLESQCAGALFVPKSIVYTREAASCAGAPCGDSACMLLRITCPTCSHVGATSASLPRVLTRHRCGHIALIRSGHEVVKPIDQPEALAGATVDDMTASILARACALSDRSVRDDEV